MVPALVTGAALWAAAGASACATNTPPPASIGAIFAQTRSDGRVTVREVPEGYPSATAGLLAGDEVLLIDGRDVRTMTPQGIHLALAGQAGTSVRLTLLRAAKIERISVVRVALGASSPP